ncbi:hypothetical protein BGZ93_008283 [Podila epicladia]|nr:hypothetical protein BGZ93_008283 [Podila epicladia]
MQELNLSKCPSFTGVVAPNCLETRSSLIDFVSTTITSDELLKRVGKDDETKPWLCKQLWYFEARFMAKKAEKMRNRNALWHNKIVFSKLVELTWLAELHVGYAGIVVGILSTEQVPFHHLDIALLDASP